MFAKLLSLRCLFPHQRIQSHLIKTEEFKILLLDNGAFHHSRQLVIPKNIHLLFAPPYSPELNPAEMIWRYIKGKTANII
ncbi:MAG: transposase [Sphingobacteriales bacterium]|nr:transposase [Sphingobacteriales bacterium]